MKIRFCSDLRLELAGNRRNLSKNPIIPAGDIMLLGGDIMLFCQMEQHNGAFQLEVTNCDFKADSTTSVN